MFSLSRLIKSFRYASRGLVRVFKEEQSFRVQVVIGFFVLILALIFHVKVWEAVALLLVTMMVLVLELINSVFERVVDVLKPRMHPYVETVKDIMAAVVLLSSLGAILIGVLILGPYVIQLLRG
ncbi:diacylglycerol kinase [Candidatus Falkowbacteria bacterium]|nr:diacylglycerol kinase [Candidatus Falkowbacteria bacterium]